MLRRFFVLALAALWLSVASGAHAALAAQKKETKTPTGEEVAETVVLIFGVRERLAQIRRSGVERGRITRTADDGRTEEIAYERSFKRGETLEKDKIRLDQRRPSLEYSLIYNEGRVFGLIRGSSFTPRQEDVATFLSERLHGLDALLRYKENGATVSFVGKETAKGIEMWVIDLEDKEKNRTRYYVSSKSGRVLWLEYQDAPAGGGTPVKFKRTFHDYRNVQGTYVPYITRLFADDRQVEESQVFSVTYGVKMEDAVFKSPDSASLQP